MTWDLTERMVIAKATEAGHEVRGWVGGGGVCLRCECSFSISVRALAARGEAHWAMGMDPLHFDPCQRKSK